MHRHGLIRLSVAALGALVLTCDAQANRPAPEPVPPPAPPPERVFDPEVVRRPTEGPLAVARTAMDEERWADARAAATAALPAADPALAGRLRWLAAAAADRAGDPTGAAEILAALAASEHALARWAALRRAELAEAEDPATALAVARPLTDAWAGRTRARRIEARSLARTGATEEAIPKLRALLEETPDDVGGASAAIPLARILGAREDAASREEAIALYRRVATRAPRAQVGQEAEALAAELLSTLPAARRRALASVPYEDQYVRAEALYRVMSHQAAEEAFAALARETTDPDRRCQARLMQGRAMMRRRARDAAATHMTRVAAECRQPDVLAAARYNAARAHQQRGRRADAIAQFELLERESPGSNLADDALFRAALAARDAGDTDGMLERLLVLPERYPDGDMKGEARFLAAMHYLRAGNAERARQILELSMGEGPGEDAEDIRGRTPYWRARALSLLDREAEAVAAYEEITQRWPLSYYAQQSIARLRELEPERADAAREGLRETAEPVPLRFPWRAEMDTEGFAAALELLRVGEIELAEIELDHLAAERGGADPDLSWLTAALLDRAGALPKSSLLVRRRLQSFHGIPPIGRGRQLWRIAYPRAFSPEIETAAAAQSVPPAFVRAVAREESAFDPRAVSVAHAYGLIQLIRPTARRFAEALDLPHDPASLKQPEINLAIGSHYISFLWQRYPDNPAVVPSAYNAGHGAVDRWVRQRPDQAFDLWVEEIPYDETRRYTRRVLQSYGIYSWLDHGQLPALPATLPER